MPRGCEGDRHDFSGLGHGTWLSFSITVDEDGYCRCFCGKITLTQPAAPPPMCAECKHPQPHHLNGWCYGPVEYDMDDCQCRRFVAPPEPELKRRIVV